MSVYILDWRPKRNGLYRNLKGFFPEFDRRPKKSSSPQIGNCIRPEFGIYCINNHCFVWLSKQLLLVMAPWLMSSGFLGGQWPPVENPWYRHMWAKLLHCRTLEGLDQERWSQRQCNTIAINLYSSIDSPSVVFLSSSFHKLCNCNFITALKWMKPSTWVYRSCNRQYHFQQTPKN